MRTKVKLKKQQIKEDKFTTFVLQSREWLEEHWQIFAVSLAAVVVVIAGGLYYIKMRSDKEIQGADRLSKAETEWRRQNFQVAILEFKSLADSYGGNIGAQAQFDLANANYDSRNYDEAIIQFQTYIDKRHQDALTTASAMAGIADCLENKQQFQAAGDKFVETIKKFPGSPAEPDYYLGAIRNYVQGGEKQKVDSLMTEITAKYPGTDYLQTATRLSMQLKTE